MVFSTSELATCDEIKKAEELKRKLDKCECVVCDAEKSWYKSGSEEIKVWQTSGGTERSVPLQTLSPVVRGLTKASQLRLYVPENHRSEAERTVSAMIVKGERHVEGNQKD